MSSRSRQHPDLRAVIGSWEALALAEPGRCHCRSGLTMNRQTANQVQQ
jgi:hypothetical protein